jgi:hypothetical protein
LAGNLIKGGLTAYKDNSKYVIKGNDAAAKILEELKAKMTPPEPEVEEDRECDQQTKDGPKQNFLSCSHILLIIISLRFRSSPIR